jgi:prevent-host-death family protein
MEHTIAAEELKANCLTVLDEVAEQGETLVVTREGRPVAMLMSLPEEAELVGGVPMNILTVDDVVLPVERWES